MKPQQITNVAKRLSKMKGKERRLHLKKLSIEQRSAVEAKLRYISRVEEIDKMIKQRPERFEDPQVQLLMSAAQRKALKKYLQEQEQDLLLAEQAHNSRVDQIFEHFRLTDKTTGIPKTLVKNIDPNERDNVVNEALSKYGLLKKYVNYFREHGLDEEPPYGHPETHKPIIDLAKQAITGTAPAPKNTRYTPQLTKTIPRKITKTTPEHEKLLAVRWYRTSKLSEEQIRVLKAHGYEESWGNVYDFNGHRVKCIAYKSGGFNKKQPNDRRESMHHFSKPFIAKEILPQIQTLVGIQDAVVDAVVPPSEHNKSLAIEFQESHNMGVQRIMEKCKPILEKFDQLAIVCPIREIDRYNPVKTDRIHVLNNKEFAEMIGQLSQKLNKK